MKFTKVLKNPRLLWLLPAYNGLLDSLSDRAYISLLYRAYFGKKPRLSDPVTFNEKLQWLKLHDRRPEYTVMVDKYRVRAYIRERIGERYLIPLFGVWDTPEAVDFGVLPSRFVLKCNHNSGLGMCICKDKAALDIPKVRKELRRGLRQDYYLTGREWPYKDVPRRIIAEQYMESDAGGLTDYKIHCFGGEPKLILVCRDRFTDTGLTEDFFTPAWEHLDLRRPGHPNAAAEIPRPEELPEMLALAEKLSAGIPFLRVDFYIVGHRIYFSELTFFPASGFDAFVPERWDETLGAWLALPPDETAPGHP